MSELWGAASGMVARQAYDQSNDLHAIAMQEDAQTIQSNDLKLQSSQMALDIQKRQIDLLRQHAEAGGTQASPTAGFGDQLRDLAEIQIESGDIEAGSKGLHMASQIDRNQAYIDYRKHQQSAQNIKTVAGLMDGVHDQASWDKANQDAEQITGHESPYKNQPYDPMFVNHLKASLTTAKEKVDLLAAQSRAQIAQIGVDAARGKEKLTNAQIQLTQDRDRKIRKEIGANGVSSLIPKKDDILAITDLQEQRIDGLDSSPEESRTLARSVAEDMLRIMKKEGKTKSEAAASAFQRALDSGHYSGYNIKKTNPGSQANPIPMPATDKDLKPNSFYVPQSGKYKGQILYYTGTGFLPPSAMKPAGDDGEDDEGDDEDSGDE